MVRTLHGTRARRPQPHLLGPARRAHEGRRLRTSPLYAPQIAVGPDGTVTARRSAAAAQMTILMPPGTYTVKLSVGGRDFTQPLTRAQGSEFGGHRGRHRGAAADAHVLRRDLDAAVDAVNRAELVRAQIYNLKKLSRTRS